MVTHDSIMECHCEKRSSGRHLHRIAFGAVQVSNLLFAVLLTSFLIGCSSASSSPTLDALTSSPVVTEATLATESPTPAAPTAAPDYVEKIRNAEYQLSLTDSRQIVQLVDGKYEKGVARGTDFVSASVTPLTSVVPG